LAGSYCSFSLFVPSLANRGWFFEEESHHAHFEETSSTSSVPAPSPLGMAVGGSISRNGASGISCTFAVTARCYAAHYFSINVPARTIPQH
jgi:hypothetical protein